MLLIGSFQPIELDVPGITERFAQPEVAAALREVGIASPARPARDLGHRPGRPRGRDAEDAPPVTDDQPRIEYATWVRPKEFGRCPAPVACASHHAAPEWRLWGLTLQDCVPPLWNRATPWPPGGRRCQSPR